MPKQKINTTTFGEHAPAFEPFIMRAFTVGTPGEDIADLVVSTVHRLIAVGVLRQGDSLPSADKLAVHLRCTRFPISRAYAQLRDAGTVETSTRAGTNVITIDTSFRSETARLLANGRRIGMSHSAMARSVRDELKKMRLAKV